LKISSPRRGDNGCARALCATALRRFTPFLFAIMPPRAFSLWRKEKMPLGALWRKAKRN